MSYTFPLRRAQFTNMIVHQSAVLDPGASANFGTLTVTGDITTTGQINAVDMYLSNSATIKNNMVVGNLAVINDSYFGNTYIDGTLDVAGLIHALTNIYVDNNLDVSQVANISNLVVTEGVMSNLQILNTLVSRDINVSNNYFRNGILFTGGGGGGGQVHWEDIILPYGNIISNLTVSNLTVLSNLTSLFDTKFGNVTMSNLITTALEVSGHGSINILSSNSLTSLQSNLSGNTLVSNLVSSLITISGDATFSNIIARDLVLDTLTVLKTSNLQGNTFVSNLEAIIEHVDNLYASNIYGNLHGTVETTSITIGTGGGGTGDGSQFIDLTQQVDFSGSPTSLTTTNDVIIGGNLLFSNINISSINNSIILNDDVINIGQSIGGTSIIRTKAVSIGFDSGTINQNSYTIAIGSGSGYDTQGLNAIAIGHNSGNEYQGDNAIAIGYNAGASNQHSNSIIINASGFMLDSLQEGSCYIAPIRSSEMTQILGYTGNEIIQTSNILVNRVSIVETQTGISFSSNVTEAGCTVNDTAGILKLNTANVQNSLCTVTYETPYASEPSVVISEVASSGADIYISESTRTHFTISSFTLTNGLLRINYHVFGFQ